MNTNVFKWIVISILGILLIVGLLLLAKKQNQAGQTQIKAFGKTLWTEKDKTAKTEVKTEDKKAA